MNLEEYVNALQVLIEERPELRKAPVYYASDDEGNAFRQVWSNGTVMYTTPDELNNYELENKIIFSKLLQRNVFVLYDVQVAL